MKHSTFRKVFWVFFTLVVLLCLAGFGTSIWAMISVVEVIQQDGLKSVVESVWNGQGVQL